MMEERNVKGDGRWVLDFEEIGAGDLATVGGKGANLGEMARAGLPVPSGFCVTTEAFRAFIAGDSEVEAQVYGLLDGLAADDIAGAARLGARIRERLMGLPVPGVVEAAVVAAWRRLGADGRYAVRSSATAEDLPDASFAGQQDSFLNVVGEAALVEAVKKAWVSLFTDRAILYRAQRGFDHRAVALSAVVQRMVMPRVSGILFTADPVSGHRGVASIDAGFGLGEALVQGIVSADNYRVDRRAGRILERRVADKRLAIWPLEDGGTETVELGADQREAASLTDEQVLALAEIGDRVEAHYGRPQDIEWVIDAAGEVFVVQSRPVTSLFPVPEPVPEDGGLHVYGSFGHAQVMTDAMTPMGRSVIGLVMPFGNVGRDERENPWVSEAGGRLYFDLTPPLRWTPTRHLILRFLGFADPLIAGAVREVAQRPGFGAGARPMGLRQLAGGLRHWLLPVMAGLQRRLWFGRPEEGFAEVEATCEAMLREAEDEMAAARPGADRLRVARRHLSGALARLLRLMPPVMGSGYVSRVILGRWAGDRVAAGDLDALLRGMSGNVTTEMDLAVGDLADLARQRPAVAARIADGDPATAIEEIREMDGAEAFVAAWEAFLDRYGMRGPSEIDIGRPRWHEAPESLVRMVAGALRGEDAAHREHHRRMAREADEAGQRLVAAVARGPLRSAKARWARRFLDWVRYGVPVREHPKYALIRVMWLAKQAMLEAADELVAAGRLMRREDVFWLRYGELIEALEDPAVELNGRVAARREREMRFPDLRPPRVITSEGEVPEVRHAAVDLPEGAMAGAAASAGSVEGIARVVLDPGDGRLEPGEILVAPFTDPGWTPLFIHAAALVMEVGGLMTHGSVVAREYGIPAVVGVIDATQRIETGQRIRVDGYQGIVQVLEGAG